MDLNSLCKNARAFFEPDGLLQLRVMTPLSSLMLTIF